MISILTPALIDDPKKLNWLKEMIASVQSQTVQQYEIIIVDDASPIPVEIELDKVRVVRTSERFGVSKCRNTAAALANYEVLLPLDADDKLADDKTLELMYNSYRKDRIIYGNLQRMDENGNVGQVFSLPDYTFQGVLNPTGIMPVTAMHSIECYMAAGGWKLSDGIEDIEYWIAAGKAGYCGHRINHTTLIYRKHELSRTHNLKKVIRQEGAMRDRIYNMHRDVYEGRFPMGCCGGGRPYVPPGQQVVSVAQATTLNDYPPEQKVWVEYIGSAQGFGVAGQRIEYKVDGPGHKLEILLEDAPKFRGAGRGTHFKVGVGAPQEATQSAPNGEYRGPTPELATILEMA